MQKKKSQNNLNKKYLQEAEKLAEIIVRNYKPEKIILYGSAARGDVRKDSDLDFCIIKDSDLPMRKRIWDVYKSIRQGWDYGLPFEPVVFTPQEFSQKKMRTIFLLEKC
ncbi:MAG: nucleotidyltransferase domain-containing protein [bacterium]